MTRKAYLKKLIQLGRTGDALEELSQIADGTYYENTSILLMGQYNSLRQDSHGLISEEQKNLRTNRLLASTNSLMKDLEQEVPAKFEEEVEVDPKKLEAPEEPLNKPDQLVKKEYHFHGPVGAVDTQVGGDFTQHIDQRTIIGAASLESMPLKELVEAEKEAGFINHEEYEELLDILEELKESQDSPTDRQKRKWSRWLGKALEAGRKFTGERLEKGIDSGIGAGLKKWIENNGLDQLKTMIEQVLN